MGIVIRQKGSRRWTLPAEFTLTDDRGDFVIQDRRRLTDRRRIKHDRNDLKVILSKMDSD